MLFNRERALELMTRFGLDALLATSRHNVLYLSDFQGWAQYTYGDRTTETFAVFFREEDSPPGLILSRQDETYYACAGSWIDDVRGYGPRSALDLPSGARAEGAEEEKYLRLIEENAPREARAGEALVRLLRDRGLAKGRVAIDEEGIRAATRARVEEALPGVSFENASGLFRLIRLQKTEAEIERLRAAATLNEEAVSAFHSSLEEGKSEREVALDYYRTVAGGEGRWSWFHLAGGRRSASIFPPSDRRFQKGDGFFFDAGLRLNHYCADVGGCGSFGEPDAARAAQFKAIEAGLEAALGSIKAGVKPSDIFRSAVEAARKSGLPGYNGAFCGHTMGIEAREFPYTLSEATPVEIPFLPDSSDVPLPAGAVLSVELPSGKFGEGGVHAEYTVLLTQTGFEHLGAPERAHYRV